MGLGSDEAWLYMPCPVTSTGCASNYRSASNWYHRYCEGMLKIDTSLDILCDDCGTAKDWKDWRFKCGNENHKFYEYATDELDFIHALGTAMSLKAHSPEKRRVVMKIINKISDTVYKNFERRFGKEMSEESNNENQDIECDKDQSNEKDNIGNIKDDEIKMLTEN
ncbi:13985_t:CDS:2 [Rhizophagus irregularis]|nr:13985_t:CDS:2 [Rhizophagus irregularis]